MYKLFLEQWRNSGGGAPEFTPPHLSILRPSPCHDAFNYELSSNPFLLNCFFGFKIDLFDIAGWELQEEDMSKVIHGTCGHSKQLEPIYFQLGEKFKV